MPAALIDIPTSVPKKKYSSARMISKITVSSINTPYFLTLNKLPSKPNIVGSSPTVTFNVLNELYVDAKLNGSSLLIPSITKLIEKNAVRVMIPASSPLILSLVLSSPVIRPPIAPTKNAVKVASQGFAPFAIITKAVAPPRTNVPSQERSAKSNTLYEMNTPSASIAYGKPIRNVSNNISI